MIRPDFSLIASNPFHLATLGLALIGWIITFAGSIAASSVLSSVPDIPLLVPKIIGPIWFYIVFELLIILGIGAAISTDSVKQYRLVILTFLATSLVLEIDFINLFINSGSPEFQAVAAGLIFLSIVTFVWIFSFGSEEGSLVSNSINSLSIKTNRTPAYSATGGFPPSNPIAMVPTTSAHDSQGNPTSTVAVSPNAEYAYKAKALYDYQANPDDQNELSFNKGEILDIADNKGKWWQARKTDGSVGIAPSNYLQIV